MADNNKNPSRQEQAINDYLQALLYEEVPQDIVNVQLDEPQAKVIGLEKLVAEIPDLIEASVVEVEAKATPEPVPEEIEPPVIAEPEPEMAQVEVAEAEPEVLTVVEDEPIPDWAIDAFQCLLFKVSGLTLAVPLVKLNSVIPWTDSIVETPNQTEWYLGLVNNLGKNVKVIDTALMVMPENRRHTIVADADDRFSHILLVDQNRWGLACDSIGDVIWMTNDKVKWRKTKKQRPWLAGTSLDHLCALIDTAVFADMLDEKVSG
ncbi:MAG: chemotaxis protein CheW [Gammaproteobacteria bacterium]|nr:chemotaxis protein CheW [Gammaproteobacteria bacterium]